MKLVISLLLNALSFYIGAYFLEGVEVNGIGAALIAGLFLGIANYTVKPILQLLTLPVTILTLGLFLLIINALVLLLIDAVVPGLAINGFASAIILGIIIWLLNLLYGMIGLKK